MPPPSEATLASAMRAYRKQPVISTSTSAAKTAPSHRMIRNNVFDLLERWGSQNFLKNSATINHFADAVSGCSNDEPQEGYSLLGFWNNDPLDKALEASFEVRCCFGNGLGTPDNNQDEFLQKHMGNTFPTIRECDYYWTLCFGLNAFAADGRCITPYGMMTKEEGRKCAVDTNPEWYTELRNGDSTHAFPGRFDDACIGSPNKCVPCHFARTYEAAYEICDAMGARLCSQREIAEGGAGIYEPVEDGSWKGSGGCLGRGNYITWTSTKCTQAFGDAKTGNFR